MVRFAVGACFLKAMCHDIPGSLLGLNGYMCWLVSSWVLVDFFVAVLKFQ